MSEKALRDLVDGLRAASKAVSSVKIPGAIPRDQQTGIVAIWPRGGNFPIGFSISWEIVCLNGEVTWLTWGNSKTRESAEASVHRNMPLCTVKYYDADPNPDCVCGCVRNDHSSRLGKCYSRDGCAEYRPI